MARFGVYDCSASTNFVIVRAGTGSFCIVERPLNIEAKNAAEFSVLTGSTRGQIMVFQIYYINHGGPMKRTLALLLLLGPASGFAASNPDIKGRDISGSAYNRHPRSIVGPHPRQGATLAAWPAAGGILGATSPKGPPPLGTFRF